MKIFIGSDHKGYGMKNRMVDFLKKTKYEVKDFGTHSKESCNYPLIGFEIAKAVSKNNGGSRGILIGKNGVGMTIIANKLNGVRAAACYDKNMARSSREDNDCNVLVLATDYTEFDPAKEIVKTWLTTKSA